MEAPKYSKAAFEGNEEKLSEVKKSISGEMDTDELLVAAQEKKSLESTRQNLLSSAHEDALETNQARGTVDYQLKHPEEYKDYREAERKTFNDDHMGGDMEKIQRAAIVEKYLREELKNMGVDERVASGLIGISQIKNKKGEVVGHVVDYIGVTEESIPGDIGTNVYESDIYNKNPRPRKWFDLFASEEDKKIWEDYFEKYYQALLIAQEKADTEITVKETGQGTSSEKKAADNQNEKYRVVRMGKIERVARNIPSGEHWIIDSIHGGALQIEAGAKVTVKGNIERCAISRARNAELVIYGKQIKSVVAIED